mgnify:CR=1 FL=1
MSSSDGKSLPSYTRGREGFAAGWNEWGGRRMKQALLIHSRLLLLLSLLLSSSHPGGGWCGTNQRHSGTNATEICSFWTKRWSSLQHHWIRHQWDKGWVCIWDSISKFLATAAIENRLPENTLESPRIARSSLLSYRAAGIHTVVGKLACTLGYNFSLYATIGFFFFFVWVWQSLSHEVSNAVVGNTLEIVLNFRPK